jgi:hypothetical protein
MQHSIRRLILIAILKMFSSILSIFRNRRLQTQETFRFSCPHGSRLRRLICKGRKAVLRWFSSQATLCNSWLLTRIVPPVWQLNTKKTWFGFDEKTVDRLVSVELPVHTFSSGRHLLLTNLDNHCSYQLSSLPR